MGLVNLYYQLGFLFLLKGNSSVLYDFCLIGFCCVLFLTHDEYAIDLKVDFPSRSTS